MVRRPNKQNSKGVSSGLVGKFDCPIPNFTEEDCIIVVSGPMGEEIIDRKQMNDIEQNKCEEIKYIPIINGG